MHRAIVCAAVVLVLVTSAAQGADLEPFFRHLSPQTNALGVVRVGAILNSPRGQKEGWAKKAEAGYLDGAINIPPVVDTLVVGEEIEPGEKGETSMVGIASLTLKTLPDLATVALRQKGRTEFVAGKMVISSPRYGYMLPLGGNMIGFLPRADRQRLARWIKADAGAAPTISPYLITAEKEAADAHVLMALDAAEMANPAHAQQWAEQSEALKGNPQAEAIAKVASSLIGVRFMATVGDDIQGVVRLDFSSPVGEFAKPLQALFLEWIGLRGATLEELATATAKAQGTAVLLETKLSPSSMRRIMTLMQIPAAATTPTPPPAADVKPPANAEEAASSRYFKEIERMLIDLTNLNKRADDYNKSALWHENYAKRIEQLPTTDVAPELVEYGYQVSTILRALADSLKGMPITLDLLEKQKWSREQYIPGYTVQYGAYGPVPGTTWQTNNYADIRAKEAAAVARGDSERSGMWKQINDGFATVRRQMQAKFGPSFGQQ